jgi:hypothetical protein
VRPTRSRPPLVLRAAFLTLAMLALVVKVAVPTGFMVASPGSGAGFPLVICTGHGPMIAHPNGEKGGEKARSDAPCAFAGHAVSAAPPISAPLPGSFFFANVLASPAGVRLAPGRGLAAPPPPSQGPPTLL